MSMLTRLRWPLLIAALGAMIANIAMVLTQTIIDGADALLPVATLLQVVGVFAFARHFAARGVKGGWPVIVGAVAALLCVIAMAAAQAGVAAGPGGLVYGMLILLPAMALTPLFQIAALIGFAQRDKSGG